MRLTPLYHWAPAERYASIHERGLVIGSASTVASAPTDQVCLSPDPRDAWQLSGAMDWVSEVDAWDLWLVHVTDDDEVMVRSDFGPTIREVKVRNSIPRERIWYVGRRSS